MGHFITAKFNAKKDDFNLQLDTPGLSLTLDNFDVGVWIGDQYEGKRTTALARLVECRDVLIERDLDQSNLFFWTANLGTGGKGSVVLDSGGAYDEPTEDIMGVVVGGSFGGASGAFETSSGVFKSIINRLMDRLNEALADR